MTVYVLDSSVLIDLVHGGLDREALAALAVEAPQLLILEVWELKERLERHGLSFVSLSAAEEASADELDTLHGSQHGASKRQQGKRLSRTDCCLLALARSRDRYLLVGDQELRRVAESYGVQSRGVLWLIQHLAELGIMDQGVLASALERIAARPRCRLPTQEVQQLLLMLRASS